MNMEQKRKYLQDLLTIKETYTPGEFLEIGRTEEFRLQVKKGIIRVGIEPESGKFLVKQNISSIGKRARVLRKLRKVITEANEKMEHSGLYVNK